MRVMTAALVVGVALTAGGATGAVVSAVHSSTEVPHSTVVCWSMPGDTGPVSGAPDDRPAGARLVSCPLALSPVRDGSVPESTWQTLRAEGWRGVPGDGVEALYGPLTPVSWDEPNAAMPSGFEHLCGALSGMPVSAVNVSFGCHA